jgi:3-deoxy-manno-octulosonate cytidylyltransferase (CMP-KDO synthetase)
MQTLCVIPARLDSTRLPGKMLLAETGKPLILHTVEQVMRTGLPVLVATDSQQIFDVVENAGYNAVMTDPCPNGTKRVIQAVRHMQRVFSDAYTTVLNVQGDEPTIDTDSLMRLVSTMAWQPWPQIATLYTNDITSAEYYSPHTVKVVADSRRRAMYFSRSPIPYLLETSVSIAAGAKKHIGVYAFDVDILDAIDSIEPLGDEYLGENLEQLSWVHKGLSITLVEAASSPRVGIDTRADYDRFVAWTVGTAKTAGS